MMLDHPNIVRLEHYFHDSENCYFLFELCRVGDLHSFIRDHGVLSVSLTRDYSIEIIKALEYLHSLNVVHRDLKPKNILIDDSFHVKIADFGAAKVVDPEKVQEELDLIMLDEISSSDDSDGSSDGSEPEFDNGDSAPTMAQIKNTCIGTPLYISPEMLEHNVG